MSEQKHNEQWYMDLDSRQTRTKPTRDWDIDKDTEILEIMRETELIDLLDKHITPPVTPDF